MTLSDIPGQITSKRAIIFTLLDVIPEDFKWEKCCWNKYHDEWCTHTHTHTFNGNSATQFQLGVGLPSIYRGHDKKYKI